MRGHMAYWSRLEYEVGNHVVSDGGLDLLDQYRVDGLRTLTRHVIYLWSKGKGHA